MSVFILSAKQEVFTKETISEGTIVSGGYKLRGAGMRNEHATMNDMIGPDNYRDPHLGMHLLQQCVTTRAVASTAGLMTNSKILVIFNNKPPSPPPPCLLLFPITTKNSLVL